MTCISGVVITKNEQRHIGACLTSLRWADELVVLDSCSTDGTRDIAEALGARVVTRPFTNFAEQRNAALAAARGEWVFFLDADERVGRRLAREIRVCAESNDGPAGYWVARRNVILGHRMRGGGWWPDKQLRLLKRGKVHYDTSLGVHEVAVVDGNTADLATPLVHYNYERLGQLFAKQDLYSHHDASDRAQSGTSFHHLARVPGWRAGRIFGNAVGLV